MCRLFFKSSLCSQQMQFEWMLLELKSNVGVCSSFDKGGDVTERSEVLDEGSSLYHQLLLLQRRVPLKPHPEECR